MERFAVLTDSAADIPAELAERMGVRIIPLHVTHDGRDYRDGVDLDTFALLDLIKETGSLPRTSQPTPADFLKEVSALVDEGYSEILYISLSAALSSTIETARALASRMPENVRMEVVDSRSATVCQGYMAMLAAAIAREGGDMDTAIERIEALRDSSRIHFIPATLDNLVRGGRASRAQGLAASVLDIHPVIGLDDDGSILVEKKAKGMRGAMRYVAKQLSAQAAEQGNLIYYKLHTRAPEDLARLEAEVEGAGVPARCLTEGTIGPVIATHVGEGAIGTFSFPAALHHPALDGIADALTAVANGTLRVAAAQ